MNKNLPLLLLTYLATIFLIFSLESWFSLWIVLELNTLTFVALLLNSLCGKSSESSVSYFIAQAISSLVILMGVFSVLFMSSPQKINFILNLSLFFKLALIPFQAWLIPVSMYLPWKLLLVLVTAQKITPLVFLENTQPESTLFLMVMCVVTCLIGSLSNLSSNSLKFLLIFSALSSTGWIVLAVLVSSGVWKLFLVVYFINLAIIFAQSFKKSKILINPIILLTWLSVAGLPPFLGFFPKIAIIIFLASTSFYPLLLCLLLISALDIFIFIVKTYTSVLTPPMKLSLTPKKESPMWFKSWSLLNLLGFMFFF